MKAIYFFVLGATILAAVSTSRAEATMLRIDRGKVITRGFLGFGVELDPMVLNANNRRRGITEADWKLLTERLAGMKMPIVRVMSQLSWFAAAGPDQFDYANPQARSLLTHLDFCQGHGIDVILTDWAWVGRCRWLKGHDDPAYAKGIATYLKHLLDERKYSCIKFLVIGNEPDNEIRDVAKYARMYHNVHAALKRAGIRGRVRLMGPDIAGQWGWFDQAAGRIADVVDAYDFHRYATFAEVRQESHETLLRNLGRFRLVVRKVDPNGAGKPILLTEMGMAGGSTNAHKMIDTFDYALHMGGYAIGALNSGVQAGLAWCAFDVYYFDRDQFMSWGMWKYKDKNWQFKPWHAVWQAVTSGVPRGCDVVAVEGASGGIQAAAVAAPLDPTQPSPRRDASAPAHGRFVLLLANRQAAEKHVSLKRPAEAPGRWWRTCCTRAATATSAPADLAAGAGQIELALPAESFTVLHLEFPPAMGPRAARD